MDDELLKDNPYDYLDIPKINRDLHRSILRCEATNAIGKSEKSTPLHIECKYNITDVSCKIISKYISISEGKKSLFS